MKISHSTAMLLMAFTLLAGCESVETKDEAATQMKEESVNKDVDSAPVIAEAKAAFEEINKLGYAWRDTEEMINEAEKAAQLNDGATAHELAKSALEQSRLAKLQYEKELNAGPLN